MANECIPIYRPGADLTCTASANVTGKTFVAQTAALAVGNPVANTDATIMSAATCGAGLRALGVAAYDAASGTRLPVIVGPGHVVPVTAGAAVTFNAEVEVNASGQAITKADGVAVGRALSTATGSGQDLFVKLY